MDLKNIIFEVSDSTAIITINRPDSLNALNHDTLKELEMIFDDEINENISVVIITGAGHKAFVAGADIKELNLLDKKSGEKFSSYGQSVLNKIENCSVPVIAAVNGYALGGGCELALACHIRIASSSAKFGQPEVKLGALPGYGGTQRLCRVIGTSKAIEYCLTGDIIDSSAALQIGLVNKVAEPELLLPVAKELASKISTMSRVTISYILKSILNSNNKTLNEGLKSEARYFAECCGTEDFKEGTDAFLQKRAPHFQNK